MQRNLTEGSILKNIWIFSIPYLLSYFLQTFYGMADLFIVGQFTDAAGITAVAIGSQVMHFLTVIIVGLGMGTTVLISQAVGARKLQKLPRLIGNTSILFTAVALLTTAILLFACPKIVSLLSTPIEAVKNTQDYLMVCFLGVPAIVAYNVVASIFRGMGDSKSPLYFVAIACVFNVILDYLFIGIGALGATGAALATVLSQTFSVFISLFAIRKMDVGRKFTKKDFIPNKTVLKSVLKIGFPISCQDGCIQISFLFITIIANSRGLEVAAAVGLVEKIICFLFLVPSAMLSTVSAVSAQNIGAREFGRAKQTLYAGLGIAIAAGTIFSIIFQFVSADILALFTENTEVVRLGEGYLRAYVFDCIIAGTHFCFSGYFCACGKSILSFIHNIISIVIFRIPGAYLASIWYPDTLVPMGIATPLGSLFSAIFCIVIYLKFFKTKTPKYIK